jgi:hypothetical protein
VIEKLFTTLCFASLSLICFVSVTSAQVDKRHEVYPEVDVWIRTHPDQQIFMYVPYTKSLDDSYRDMGIGAMYSWSFEKNNLIMFDWLAARENLEKFRNVTVRTGFYYGQSLDDSGSAYRERSIPSELHLRWQILGGILLADRNRIELRWLNDGFSWRYRNRLTIERQVSIFGVIRPTPYTSLEIHYDSRYSTFNKSRIIVGAVIPIFSFTSVDINYQFVNDTRSSIQNQHGLGVTLSIYIEPKDIFN